MICKRYAVTRDGEFATRDADGEKYIEGYFALYNSRYELFEGAYETIDPGAFDGQVEGDVRALTNHDTTLVLGRTAAGTLALKLDDRGLLGSIKINGADQDAVNLYERVKRRDVTQCSFGFDILDETAETSEGGATVWHLRKVRLYEVSVVTFPAYEDTGVAARKAEQAETEKRRREQWRARMTARLKGVNNGT